jgi:hypothetical protein
MLATGRNVPSVRDTVSACDRQPTAFSARLCQRAELDALTAELLAVVDQTVQPQQASSSSGWPPRTRLHVARPG